ncbi:MAG: FAD-dependent oxidoreductase [Syntrophomonadaceae bacterium]|nr:FAD-dependent oxidoreductase [Syntrophomonadaceae bacterium]
MMMVTINGKSYEAAAGQTLLELATANGIHIPTLCHDPRLHNYGACGICVVEDRKTGKLLRACSTNAAENMEVETDSEKVLASRRMTLRLLLSDHSGDCRPPCLKACPAHTDCQGYVGLIANGEYEAARALIEEQIPLPGSIGMICPHPCEEACRRHLVDEPINIAALKVFAAHQAPDWMPGCSAASGKKVGIIGAGPAGLTAAYFLRRAGHAVTIYEAMPEAGGMLRYGIPEYRLPRNLLKQEVERICRLGVEIKTDCKIGRDIELNDIISSYDAVFLGIGAWRYSRIGCAGEDMEGVLGGIDFLRAAAMHQAPDIGRRVAVLGGGNTAMDAARTAVRLGAEQVMVLYRRTRAEMPAEPLEIVEAEEDGVIFKFLVAPDEIIGENGRAKIIRVQQMRLGEPDSSGRRRPEPVEGAYQEIEIDTIIAAIGQQVDMSGLTGIEASRWKSIGADDITLATNIPGVFAGGDGVTGPGIAVEAVAQGKQAALSMMAYLNGEAFAPAPDLALERTITAEQLSGVPKAERLGPSRAPAAERAATFANYVGIMTPEQAQNEARRCLECGCQDYFDCKLIECAHRYELQAVDIEGAKHHGQSADRHPFVLREPAKCILCGMCVRVCEEVAGLGAIGLVGRGFDTRVEAEPGLTLESGSCNFCGLCISICPTGALMGKYPVAKRTPLALDETGLTCKECGQRECELIVRRKGNTIFDVTPGSTGYICAQGRDFALYSAAKH